MENETQIAEKQSFLQQHLMSIPELEVGQIVTGTVVQTNDEIVLVDIGYKSEGKIPVDEFMELPKVGDKVAVKIIRLDDGRGQVVVSKKGAEVLHRRCLDRSISICLEYRTDRIEYIVTSCHFCRTEISRTLWYRRFLCHRC